MSKKQNVTRRALQNLSGIITKDTPLKNTFSFKTVVMGTYDADFKVHGVKSKKKSRSEGYNLGKKKETFLPHKNWR